jgi:LuxR family maltose regulon positive regulatory protein
VKTPIITTKLFLPSHPPNLVSRPRLLKRLEHGSNGKLTLISAQAGFGKTTLLSEWISQCGRPVCWISLDERDNDPQRFLKYILAGLQRLNKNYGESTQFDHLASRSQEAEDFLTNLVNDISTISEPLILVLDDYHVITEALIQQMMLFLLDHMPPQMHMIVSSRSDPPWPLSRLKVYGEILEIRSQEMRFTMQEAATFLNDMMGLELSAENIAALEKRTEGWIVGLQMAALSLQQRPDKDAFIEAFTGSHRYVVDYLVEEVLEQQPPEIQDFLLKTSILTRLSGPLCNAVVGRQDSQDVLVELEQKNLFLIPLDDERRWFRYHHLFADLLHYHLKHTLGNIVLDLHERASTWYEENGLMADAIHHALVANKIDRIVQLMNDMIIQTLDYSELKALLDWLERLPEPEAMRYPWLLVTRTWAYFNAGDYMLVEENLVELDRLLTSQAIPGESANRIRGHAAAIRSYLAELRENPQTAMQQAEDALAWLPGKDIHLRALVAIRWANCLAWLGDLERAIPAYREAGESSKLAGEGQQAIIALSEMAVVQMLSGKLIQAIDSITEVNNYADFLVKRDGRRLPAMGILYRHISFIQHEQNELTKAEYYAREAIKICRQWGEKESLLGALLALTRVQFTMGQYEKVEQNLKKITQIAGEISPIYVKQLVTWNIHYQLLMGRLEGIESWVQDLGLKADHVFGYERCQDYQNYACYLFAKRDYFQALEVVDALLKVVTDVGASMFAIKYKVLKAIFLYKIDKINDATGAFREALSMAGAEGYVRSILDQGESVEDLLKIAIAKGIEVDYASKLLAAHRSVSKPSPSPLLISEDFADPLSPREMEVLRFFATDLTAPEIARELVISANTVRSHIKNIYSKLDAHNRYEALRKARELDLL